MQSQRQLTVEPPEESMGRFPEDNIGGRMGKFGYVGREVSSAGWSPSWARETTVGSFVELLSQRAARTPELALYKFLPDREGGETQCIGAGALEQRARAIAAELVAQGAAGERVLLLHAPGLDYVAALYGVWFAGAVAVPAYPPQSSRHGARVSGIARDARARFALTSHAALERLRPLLASEPELAKLRFSASDDIDLAGAARWQAPSLDPSSLALLQYTSGSTGDPKGVVLTQGHFLANTRALMGALGRMREGEPIHGGDKLVGWLPPYHDMGLIAGILMPLVADASATLMSPLAFLQRPARWLEAIGQERATVTGAPNFAYELCIRRVTPEQKRQIDLSQLSIAISGAERVRSDTLRRFSEAFAECGFRPEAWAPSYGLAEATLGVSFRATNQGAPLVKRLNAEALGSGRAVADDGKGKAVELVGCGRALPGTEIIIVDPETRRPLAPGSVGEIWVRSPSVALGYFENPEATSRLFGVELAGATGKPYLRSGDLGFLEEGELFVTGRLKDLLIFGGVNFYPEDIEGCIEGCHAILRPDSGVAFAVEHDGEERLVVVQEIDRANAAKIAEALEAIARAIAEACELSVYDVALVTQGQVPRTSSGKLQRSLCRERYLAGQLKIVGQLPQATTGTSDDAELVGAVARLMASTLGVEPLRPDADFFELGAHSLLATQLVSRVRDSFGVELSLRDVFQFRSPAALAGRIAALPQLGALPELSRVPRQGLLPLTFSQERMWLLNQLEPDGAAYNVAGAVLARGPLEPELLERALSVLVERHELLRSRYPTVDGQPRLEILPQLQVGWPCEDVSTFPDPMAEARRRASELAGRPFDVARDVLLRAAAYRLGPDAHLLVLSLHHLITDAWSMGILARELGQVYAALRSGRTVPHAPEGLGYVDYAAWQRSAPVALRFGQQLEYWRATLKDVEPVELPSDRPRTLRRTSRGAFEPLVLPSGLLDRTRAVAQRAGATPFMLLLTVFEVLVHRYTRQADLVVGVPVANRNRLASEGLVGTLVNTLPVRVGLRPEQSFASLLATVREACLDAYAHQDLPFERLVAELSLARRAGESPLIQVMFDYQNAPTQVRDLPELTLEPLMITRGAAQFDLSFFVFDTELGQSAGVEYSTDLFDRATVQRLLGHYLVLLEGALAEPGRAISRLPLLTALERNELLARANSTFDRPPPQAAVHELFDAQAAKSPEATAVSDASGALSYAELARRAESLAARLQAAGAAPGARVAVLLERSVELVVALLAIAKTGAAWVPLDPQFPPARVRAVLEDASPRLVLSQRKLRERFVLQSFDALSIDDATAPEARFTAAPPDLSRPAYVIYTSGSTGKPKGVVVPHLALSNFLAAMQRLLEVSAGDRLLAVTTISFDIAGLELLLPLVAGASVHIASSAVAVDGAAMLSALERQQTTLFQATPATFRLLLEAGWTGRPGLTVLCGGEAFPRDLAEQLLPRATRVFNVYGPTETTIWSTAGRVKSGDGLVPIGAPLERTRLYVLDEHAELLPQGVPGELCIGGDGVALGYHNLPELTAERFVPDTLAARPDARFYKTGDLARLRGDGEYECLGRLDQQIKLRGFRIEPAEIENALKDGGQVADAVVVAREIKSGDSRLVAYYVPRAAAVNPAELQQALRLKLPAYMVPSAFVELAALPRTANGKLDRKALPAFEQKLALGQHVAPRSELERAIASTWSQVLGVSEPSVHDDFFAVGGHSLLGVRLLARLEREHGVNLALQALLEAPTISALAQLVQRSQSGNGQAAAASNGAAAFRFLVPIQPRGSAPPLVCVHGAGGNVVNLRFIAEHLGQSRPFYGVQARGVDGVEAPFESIEEMASAYLSELRTLAPRGPYYLSGYCGGGIVAFEMARMLLAARETVAFVGLIDTYRPDSVRLPRLPWLRHVSASIEGISYLARQTRRGFLRNRDELVQRGALRWHRATGERMPHELREAWLTEAFFRAARNYRPGPFDGDLVAFRAIDANPILTALPGLGWRDFARNVDVIDVPGNHLTLALEPNAAVLGDQLLAQLAAADARWSR